MWDALTSKASRDEALMLLREQHNLLRELVGALTGRPALTPLTGAALSSSPRVPRTERDVTTRADPPRNREPAPPTAPQSPTTPS